jgi:hypothetical protein
VAGDADGHHDANRKEELMTIISENFKNAAVGTMFGGSLLLTAGMGMAGAEPLPAPDGLVNVTQGGALLLENVPADVAASTITALCGPATPDVPALAQQVDTLGVSQTACAGLPAGDVVLAQNVSTAAPSPVVPGTEGETAVDPAQEPAADVPPGSEESVEGDTSGAGAAVPPEPEEEEAGSPAADESIGATWDPI